MVFKYIIKILLAQQTVARYQVLVVTTYCTWYLSHTNIPHKMWRNILIKITFSENVQYLFINITREIANGEWSEEENQLCNRLKFSFSSKSFWAYFENMFPLIWLKTNKPAIAGYSLRLWVVHKIYYTQGMWVRFLVL